VRTAANGKEALALYEQYGDAIALVLTDLVMPEMGGVVLCQALWRRNPCVKILLMTGCPVGGKGQALWEERVLGRVQNRLPSWSWHRRYVRRFDVGSIVRVRTTTVPRGLSSRTV
jgi:response regulator RpfG family c-di-GMP phosphodiesterase